MREGVGREREKERQRVEREREREKILQEIAEDVPVGTLAVIEDADIHDDASRAVPAIRQPAVDSGFCDEN